MRLLMSRKSYKFHFWLIVHQAGWIWRHWKYLKFVWNKLSLEKWFFIKLVRFVTSHFESALFRALWSSYTSGAWKRIILSCSWECVRRPRLAGNWVAPRNVTCCHVKVVITQIVYNYTSGRRQTGGPCTHTRLIGLNLDSAVNISAVCPWICGAQNVCTCSLSFHG